MDDLIQKAKEIMNLLSLEEKAKLTVGKDFWHTFDNAYLKSIMLTDGPHGLRKQEGKGDHLGLQDSIPATCFPTGSALACSFDRSLLYEVGEAIGKECVNADVAVLLGPGINIKRSPLGGRNFEYYSEDPYVSGLLGSSFIQGVQSLNVGTSLKHFACNNQEYARMVNNSIVDARALHEIYLKPFEIAVKEAKPWSLMCAYNKINGVYASAHRSLLKKVLRETWGYQGIVLSDWGAVSDKVLSIQAGLNLEMPASKSYLDVVDAVVSGILPLKSLDACCLELIHFLLKTNLRELGPLDVSRHHQLAREVSSSCIVLAKNEASILPLLKTDEVLIVGPFAKKPRIQGSGSSKVHPIEVDQFLEKISEKGVHYDYAEGYALGSQGNEALVQEVLDKAKDANKVIVFLGLPESYENEGIDRKDLKLPLAELQLMEALSTHCSDIIVVLQSGGVVELPFFNQIQALLVTHLGGEAVGGAIADVLVGDVNPSGHFAETWPLKLEDTPCLKTFADSVCQTIYAESLFVGYRYYDKVEQPVLFPFGFGLSYTTVSYDTIRIEKNQLIVTIVNVGDRPTNEVVQVYVADTNKNILRPRRELKAWEKVSIMPKEKKEVCFEISAHFFEFYSLEENSFQISGGVYELWVGDSSRHLPLMVEYVCEEKAYMQPQNSYFEMRHINQISLKDFEQVYGCSIPACSKKKHYTLDSTWNEAKKVWIGKLFFKFADKQLHKTAQSEEEYNMSIETMTNGPIRMMGMGMPNKTMHQLQGIVDMLNGRKIAGLLRFLKRDKRLKKKK